AVRRNVIHLLDPSDDSCIQQTARLNLKKSGYHPLGRLTCSVEDGVVTLAGAVPTFFLKQMAQSIVQRIEHVQRIENRVRVD
ncbi:MAG TPA: BON domain-containing protein, partial [Planctomycetaceae bacterium]|nr:BON domain-containing protein [Planctomycetaceae bacterium]